ncbi:MAG: plastocyanin/azurin family copper-binding protein [Chloroflexota bacterium]
MGARALLPVVLSTAIAVAAAAAAAVVAGPPRAALAASQLVVITSSLNPAVVTIGPGDTVTWRNDDGTRHRMRSTSGPAEFDSGNLDPGATFSFTFSETGTYAYRDERDPNLSNYWGTITVNLVTPPPGVSPTPAPPGATPPPAGATVTMAGRVFRPATITIAAGGRVTWLNDDGRDHTVTARDASFDSGLMGTGATFVRTFTVAGTFAYLCVIHPDMTGTVAVTPAPGTTAPPAPAPTPVPPPPSPSDVSAIDFAFSPATIDIVVGTRVTWANRGIALHTVTATDGSFDSGLMAAGASFARLFGVPGTFPYLCVLHPSMTGVVRVAPAPGATAPPALPTVPPTPRPTAPPGAARILDFAFSPTSIRVTAGSAVTWVNEGVAPHTVTSRTGAFDSRIIAAGGRYTRTFETPGTFLYLCSLHPDMTGSVLVAAADGQVPPPAPIPTPGPGGGGVGPGSSAPPGIADARMLDFAFDPLVLTVSAGTTVRWHNVGVAIHTVTATDGTFDSGFIDAGDEYTRTFTKPGAVDYVCALHPQMIGTVVVLAAGSAGDGDGQVTGDLDPAAGGGGNEPGAAGGGPGAADPTGSASGDGVDPMRLAVVLGLIAAAFAAGGVVIRDTLRRVEAPRR